MNIFNRIIPIFMISVITILVAGLIKINFYHHLTLPKEILNKNTILSSYIITPNLLFINKKYDIYLVDEIKSYRQTQDVIETLNEARKGDEVIIHLAGFGGGVEQVIRMINAMKTTKAHVTTQVESPVYSGHAYLALYGHKLIVEPYAYLMLHTTSAYGETCEKETGMDRGQTQKESCELGFKNHLILVNQVIMDMPFISKIEKDKLFSGKDVYLQNISGKTLEFTQIR